MRLLYRNILATSNLTSGNHPGMHRVYYQHYLALLILLVLPALGCRSSKVEATKVTTTSTTSEKKNADVFSDFLNNDGVIADGFSSPLEKKSGWQIVSPFGQENQAGENWEGFGNTDVYAVANGRIIAAEDGGEYWKQVIVVEHTFYENHEKKTICSIYRHLSKISVKSGDVVKKHQLLGTVLQESEKPSRLNFELRWDKSLSPTFSPSEEGKSETWIRENYVSPTGFISQHQSLPIPQQEATLVLVDQKSYKMRLYRKGVLRGEYDVSFGQSKGQKQIQGDNKTPKGMYFVVYKHRGKFDGASGNYYGGHWIKINYPNRYDAARGRNDGLVTTTQEEMIRQNWEKRLLTLQNTLLGGGIGFHGWAHEWDNRGSRHLSWGCVVMHIYDITKVYDQLPEGAMVIIF